MAKLGKLKRGEQPISFDMVTTRGGDNGQTSDFSGRRVFKNSAEMEVIGEIDELNCFVGLLLKAEVDENPDRYIDKYKRQTPVPDMLNVVQNTLQRAMGVLATHPKSKQYETLKFITDTDIEMVEEWEQLLLQHVHVPQRFVNPQTYADLSRVICRRAERRLISYIRELSELGKSAEYGRDFHDLYAIQQYLNRLGDFFFLVGREEDHLRKG